MLKIKDNVDLKELGKFGFKPRFDEITGKIVRYITDDKKNIIRYIDNDHNHNPYWEVDIEKNYILFRLTKADLI